MNKADETNGTAKASDSTGTKATRLPLFVKKTFTYGVRLARFRTNSLASIYRTSLYRNAIYIMLANISVSFAGFFFWVVAANLYSPEAVGFASAAVSAISMLALISDLGMDGAIVRFLPTAGKKAGDMINSCFTVGILASIVLAIVFVTSIDFWSPALTTIRNHPAFLAVFVISVGLATVNSLIQSVFVAKLRAGFALTRALLFGLSRFIPLIFLAALLQSFGIVTSLWFAYSIAALIGLIFLIPRVQPGYHPFPVVKREIVNRMLRFSVTNYLANLFWNIPALVLPILVTNVLGTEQNAYFYVSWGIGNIFFLIPVAMSTSLLAEGSHDEERLRRDVRRSLKLTTIIIGTAVFMTLLLGDRLLLLYGKTYSESAKYLLWILVLSSLPMSINYLYLSVKRVRMQMKMGIAVSVCIAIGNLALSCVLMPRLGIIGVGVGTLVSQATAALVVGWRMLK